MKIFCQNCNIEFKKHKSSINRSNNHYCSQTCFTQGRNKQFFIKKFVKITPFERFFSKISFENHSNKCWIWTGSKDKAGYGLLRMGKKFIKSHRYAYQLYNGNFDNKLFVCHKCDNPSCNNPEHLFLGTAKENNLDRVNKNRNANQKGSNQTSAILNEKLVLEIRDKLKNGYLAKYLAIDYGVHKTTIADIKHRRTWSHI